MSLQAAIAAVRAESGDRSTGARATRGRVLASIERSPRHRIHAVVAAVIASMFGASAFAWYGRPLQTPAAAPPAIVQDHVAPAPEPVRPVQVVARVDMRVIEEPVVEPAPVEPALPRAAASEPAPPVPDVAPATVAEAAPAQPDAELALYAAAHELHFKTRDMTAALAAWNQYLAAAPMGRLAPEARFNRLVALVKLERWDDAARDLDALAESTYRAADVERLRGLVNSRRPR
ncbi:MAG TPA: hypothetical protein VIV11_26480 [Kofleriaceae bacterium]